MQLANAYATEICASCGYDWVLIDGEHSPNDIPMMAANLQAVAGYGPQAVARVPVGDTVLMKQYLDIGAQTVLVPMVDTAEQAAAMVRATRYPPHGIRGVGAFVRDGDEDVPILSRKPASPPLRVAASRSHLDERTAAAMRRMGEVESQGLGSSLKFCRIAEGRMDVYPRFGPTSEWDTAAAQCVLEAAGGAVLTLDGQPLRYNHKESLLNPDFIALGDAGLPWRDWLHG